MVELEGFQQHHVDEGYPPAKPRLQSINKKEWDALSHVEQAALLEEVKKIERRTGGSRCHRTLKS